MKLKLALITYAAVLVGCSQPAVTDADPSAEQEKAAERAYIELRDGNYDAFLAHLDPKLQSHFQDNEKIMKKFSRSIPKGEYKSKTLMVKQYQQDSKQHNAFKVSYEIAYPKNLVQYDVSFDQPNGSTQIQDFNIRVFGE